MSLLQHEHFGWWPHPTPANVRAEIARMSWGYSKPRAILMTRAACGELAQGCGCNVWVDETLPDSFDGIPIIEAPGERGEKLWWLVLPPAEMQLRLKWIHLDGCDL